jgi:integrase
MCWATSFSDPEYFSKSVQNGCRKFLPPRFQSDGLPKCVRSANWHFRSFRKVAVSYSQFHILYLKTMNYTGCRPLDEDLPLILANCSGRYAARDRCLILAGVYTGFRIKELLSITVDSIWNGSRVTDSVTVQKGFMKCKVRSRTMPLHEELRIAIAEWLAEYLPGLDGYIGRPLFPRQRTLHPLSRSKAADMIKSAAARAGLDTRRISCHSTRKEFARRMWESPIVGKDMAKMARLLGHENFSNTLRYLEFADELEQAVLA